MKYCTKCGMQIQDDAKFCVSCGTPQNGVPQNRVSQNGVLQNGAPQNGMSQNGMPPQKKSNAPFIIAGIAVFAAFFILVSSAAFLFVSGKLDGLMGSVADFQIGGFRVGDFKVGDFRINDFSADSFNPFDWVKQDVFSGNADKESGEAEDETKVELSDEEQEELAELEAMLAELSGKDMASAFPSEMDLAAAYEANVERFLDAREFGEARREMVRWQNLLDAVHGHNPYTMNVEQVDVSEYPRVKVYLRIEDSLTLEAVDGLEADGFFVYERMEGTNDFMRHDVLHASQLDNMESLNINMVADVSGSMDGRPLREAAGVMNEFLNSVQPQAGDKVSLTTFASQVNMQTAFTSDIAVIRNAINSMYASGGTALYDALYMAVSQTAAQDGAKCIIGFTDGIDNDSKCTPQIVAQLAQRYSIPIYLIGVGSGYDTRDLQDIANATGGFYRSVDQIGSMADIYNMIFREQKEMYLVEYETQQDNENVSRNLYLDYVDETLAVRKDYSYVPQIYMEGIVSGAQMFVNDFIIYDSDRRYVTRADLDRLTQEQLRLARNEIYARKGRRFHDQYLQNYFDSKSWYRGTILPDSFSESYFNDYERANAYFIADYERLKGFIE